MAMGRRKQHQEQMFLPTARGGGHRFYEALNKLLAEAEFDRVVEELCAPHYASDEKPGRPSLAPGIFFRMMFVGYFEGIGSERGIAWRCADSMSLRDFLGLPAHVAAPDSTTVSRTRRRLPKEVIEAVFERVLAIVASKGLLKGRVRGVDSTYLQADASMKAIVRKDTGEGYREYIKDVAAEDDAERDAAAAKDDDVGPDGPNGPTGGVTSPRAAGDDVSSTDDAPTAKRKVTAEEAVRHDRRRKKRTSNEEWKSSTDEDARIVRMKNGTTRLAYKPEHVVDMETGVILAAEVFLGNEHDAATIERSLAAAEKHLGTVQGSDDVTEPHCGESWHQEPLAEVVADKGYHKAVLLLSLKNAGYRTYIPERKQRGRRKFIDKGGIEAAHAFHANRTRTQRPKGKAHQRRRGELLERPNQHLYERGGLRNLTVTGQVNVQKRVLLQAAAFNLGQVLRKTLGAGAPKWLVAVLAVVTALLGRADHAASRRFGNGASRLLRFGGASPALSHGHFGEESLFTAAC